MSKLLKSARTQLFGSWQEFLFEMLHIGQPDILAVNGGNAARVVCAR